MEKNLKPIGSLLGDAWRLYKKHMNELALVAVIPFLFIGVKLALWPYLYSFVGVPRDPASAVVAGCFSLLYIVFIIILPFAMITAMGEAHHGTPIDVNTVYKKAFSSVLPYLFIVVVMAIIVFGGSVLFIIPGIIASIYLVFALYVYALEKKEGLDALVRSAWYVRHFWWDILARKVTLAIVAVAAIFVFSLFAGVFSVAFNFGPVVFTFLVDLFIFLFVIPFSFAFYYQMYRDVKQAKQAREESGEPSRNFLLEAERFFIILIIVAAVAALFLFCIMNLVHVTHIHRAGIIMIGMHHGMGSGRY